MLDSGHLKKDSQMKEEMTVKQYVAERLMDHAGFGDKEKYPLEWDPEYLDSQLAGYLDIADVSVSATIDALQSIGLIPEDSSDEEKKSEKNLQYDVEDKYPIHHQATIYIILKQKAGEPLTLGDLRDFMHEVDPLGLSDNTEIEGEIHLMYDLGLSGVEVTDYLGDHNETKALLLHPRRETPFVDHPSVSSKSPDPSKEDTMNALLTKYGYYLSLGQETEAAKIFDEIQNLRLKK